MTGVVGGGQMEPVPVPLEPVAGGRGICHIDAQVGQSCPKAGGGLGGDGGHVLVRPLWLPQVLF